MSGARNLGVSEPVGMSNKVDEWVVQAPEAQREQLHELRALIRSLAPDAVEALKWGRPCYSRSALFCYLHRAKSHVTLGFQKGALMSDPGKRLLGDGKQMRHIEFGPGEAVDIAACTALIQEALRLDRIGFEPLVAADLAHPGGASRKRNR